MISAALSALFVIVTALAGFFCFPQPAAADAGAPWDGYATPADYYVIVIAEGGANIRTQPSTAWDAVEYVDSGQRLHVINTATNFDDEVWLEIDSPSGWIIATAVVDEADYQPPEHEGEESDEESDNDEAVSSGKTAEEQEADEASASTRILLFVLLGVIGATCIVAMISIYMLFIRNKTPKQPPYPPQQSEPPYPPQPPAYPQN